MSVQVVARAKLTLSLRVGARRPDGFHDLDGWVVSVTDPHDTVTLTERSQGIDLRVSGDAAAGVPADETNLARRAAQAWQEAAGVDAGVRIDLRKTIPPGAGLGGGSADAAAVLVGVGALWGRDLGGATLHEIAARLGSDVPFCVRGGAARMRGRGEVVEPVAAPDLVVVVAVAPFACSTAEVYAAWDALGGPTGREVSPPTGVGGLPRLVNDLEPAAMHVQPALAPFREAVESAAGRPALLAGSGSSYAVLFAGRADADDAAARVRGHVGARVHVGEVAPVGVVVTH